MNNDFKNGYDAAVAKLKHEPYKLNLISIPPYKSLERYIDDSLEWYRDAKPNYNLSTELLENDDARYLSEQLRKWYSMVGGSFYDIARLQWDIIQLKRENEKLAAIVTAQNAKLDKYE